MAAFVKVNWLEESGTTDPEEVTGATAFALNVTATDVPSGFVGITLQGSVDGVSWVNLVGATHFSPGSTTDWAVDKPVQYIRLNASISEGAAGYASVLAV